jgi:hypothetical protein
MLEAVSEFDDKIMEKFFEAPETITEREVLDAFVKQLLQIKLFLWFVVHLSKTKVFKQCWICYGINAISIGQTRN